MSSLLVVIILASTIGGVTASTCLLGAWAALSNRPWAVRGATLIVPPAALCFVTAYTPAIFSTVLLVCVVLPLVLAKPRCLLLASNSNRGNALVHRRLNFSIKDIMWLVALAAGFTAVLATAVRRHLPFEWLPFVENAIWYSAQTVVVTMLILGRWRLRGAVITATILIAVLIGGWFRLQHADNDWLGVTGWSEPTAFYLWSWLTHLSILLLAVGLARCIVSLGQREQGELCNTKRRQRIHWAKRCAQCGALAFATGLAGYLVWIMWMMAFPPPIPEQNRPGSNRYKELVEVAKSLGNVITPWDVGVTLDDFDKWVQARQTKLTKARQLVNENVYVPLDYTSKGTDAEYLYAASEVRNVGRAIIAEGITAENKGDTNHAIQCYTDAVRLGQKYAENGLLIQYLTGHGIEGMGMHMLTDCRETLDRQQCQQMVEFLAGAENAFVPLDETYQRDLVWSLHTMGWFGRFWFSIEDALGYYQSTKPSLVEILKKRHAVYRLLIIELAIRMHRLVHNQPPTTLADLVPAYLDEVPKDPFSSAQFVYRANADGTYLLYSVGQNAINDGGVIATDDDKQYSIPGDLDVLIADREWAIEEQGDFFLDQESWLDFDNELKFPSTGDSLDGESNE